MIQLVILSVLAVSFLFALLVIVNNPKGAINRLYFLFSIFSMVWLTGNLLSTPGPITLEGSNLLFAARLITPASLLALFLYLIFIYQLKSQTISRPIFALAFVNLIIVCLSFTNLNVQLSGDGVVKLGSLYPFYGLCILLNITFVFAALFHFAGDKSASANIGSSKNMQLKYLQIGALLSFVPILILGLVVPFFSTSSVSNLSPVFSVFFIGAAAIAVVRHRLFDIRLIVARSVAYVLLITTLAGIFAFGVLGVTGLFFSDSQPTAGLRFTYTALAILLAFLLQPLKRFFDRLTNRLFYQDAYDSQQFLDSFNKILVSAVETSDLLVGAGELIKENLKVERCTFLIRSTEHVPARVIGDRMISLSEEDILNSKTDSILLHMPRDVVQLDDLTGGAHEEHKEFLRNSSVAIAARLKATQSKRREYVGFMLLSQKKSGSPYSTQDINVINIITKELVIAVQNALRFEEIQSFNITLQQKIDDATRKLRQTNEKLKALDETKDEFISMASHQLRTPLTSVKGYISMVMEGDAGKISGKQNELLNQAFTSAQRMVYLIADLLNVSRLKTGKFIIERKPTQLADVIEAEISQLTETAKGRNLELTYDKPKNFPIVMLDETKTRQVIMNFADNAIYYTPSGGHIHIALEDTGKAINFTVSDDGIGVPKAEQHHLFGKFYRAGNAQKARPDGTGLGLFMAKKVVVAQGGAIIFNSEEGKGSTFGFTFPRTEVIAPNGTKPVNKAN